MKRTWRFPVITLFSAGLLVAGLAIAEEEEETPLGKIMAKVQKNNATILKNVRTKVAFAKGQQSVVSAAEDLTKLGKEAREIPDAAKEAKRPMKEWTDLMDTFIKQSEEFAKLAAKKETTYDVAKKAYNANVVKACNDCHKIFRPDEE
ncbi:MAG: hypothetical protein IRY99_06565 [Isosphaeraceae bacterium]|nr:hypothetical protein [Isosphaeraceae bacterium]